MQRVDQLGRVRGREQLDAQPVALGAVPAGAQFLALGPFQRKAGKRHNRLFTHLVQGQTHVDGLFGESGGCFVEHRPCTGGAGGVVKGPGQVLDILTVPDRRAHDDP